jgi:hypothetical protein
MRDRFTLELRLENDELGTDPQGGVARILREVATAIERGTRGAPIYDINGNCVGRFDMMIDED